MKLYLAAMYTNGYRAGGNSGRYAKLTEAEKRLVDQAPNLLESYHYVHKDRFVRAMRQDGVKVFLDSGAFSAHTLGVEIDIREYSAYIRRNNDILRKEDGVVMASVLDGIGDPEKTLQNQKHMEQLGAKPLPCFHYGEHPKYLEHYVANYSYITLGGMVGKSAEQLIAWLDPMWGKYLCDGSGKPKLKVHAFGITAQRVMERYPWWSVDSSSWIQKAAFGIILHPIMGSINVSSQSRSLKQEGQHYATLSDIEQDAILRELENKGFTFERLSTIYESRAAYNIWAYGTLGEIMRAREIKTFRAEQETLW